MGESLYIRRTGTRCLGLRLKDLVNVWIGTGHAVVEKYDPAIEFFVDKLGFELVEDSPSFTNEGRPKRWVVVRPPGVRREYCSRRPKEVTRPPLWGARSLAVLASFCEWMISIRPSNEWRPTVSNSFPLHAPNHTALSQCFSTSPATAGTCSAPGRRSRW